MRYWLLLSTTLVALALSACDTIGQNVRVPQSPMLASLERKSGLIAYLGLDGNVYTIDQAGGKQQMITQDAFANEGGESRSYNFPTWSMEDSKLAYVRFDLQQNGKTTASILATDGDREEPRELYSSQDHMPIYLYWSPDGEWLSFLSAKEGTRSLAMQIAPAAGGEASLVDTGNPLYWAWSPESMQIMAHVGGSAATNPGVARLSLLELEPIVREVGLGIAPTNFQAPVYSPDGKYALLAGDSGRGRQELLLTNSTGQLQHVITEYEGNISFDWAPKGDYAAFLTSNTDNQTLSFLDLSKPSEPEIFETEAQNAIGFFWAPDGKKVAIFEYRLQSEAAEGEAQSLENSSFWLDTFVAEARTGEREYIGSFQPTEPFLDVLRFNDQYQRSTTIWSPNSVYLVVSSVVGDGTEGLFIVPASGDFDPRFLTEGRLGIWSWE